MAKGKDEALSQAEAELFMEKAQNLMLRHELTMKDIMGTDKLWIKRPVGAHFKRWPMWMGCLGMAICDIYHVRCIRTYTYVQGQGYRYYLEFFGEPDNLDIAEYVYHAVLNNGKVLFLEALREHNLKLKNDPIYRQNNSRWSYESGKTRARKFTESSFMLGLISEWRLKMEQDKTRIEHELNSEDASYAIVSAENEKLLEEMYGEAYPNMRKLGRSSSSGLGGSAGRRAGAGLNIGTGIRSGSGQLRLKG